MDIKTFRDKMIELVRKELKKVYEQYNDMEFTVETDYNVRGLASNYTDDLIYNIDNYGTTMETILDAIISQNRLLKNKNELIIDKIRNKIQKESQSLVKLVANVGYSSVYESFDNEFLKTIDDAIENAYCVLREDLKELDTILDFIDIKYIEHETNLDDDIQVKLQLKVNKELYENNKNVMDIIYNFIYVDLADLDSIDEDELEQIENEIDEEIIDNEYIVDIDWYIKSTLEKEFNNEKLLEELDKNINYNWLEWCDLTSIVLKDENKQLVNKIAFVEMVEAYYKIKEEMVADLKDIIIEKITSEDSKLSNYKIATNAKFYSVLENKILNTFSQLLILEANPVASIVELKFIPDKNNTKQNVKIHIIFELDETANENYYKDIFEMVNVNVVKGNINEVALLLDIITTKEKVA